jgi:hypothetical protein
MKLTTTTTIAIALAALAALAAPAQDATVLTTLFGDGTTNTWTQADLQAALQLTNRKYHRDMETRAGRQSWHGKPETRYATNVVAAAGGSTNKVTQTALIETYPDGFIYTNSWRAVKPRTASDIARRLAADKAARAAALAAQTNGVPAAVIAARKAAIEAVNKATTTNITVIVGD